MIKYSSYTNHLRFSFHCHHNKILPKDLKRRIKAEQSFLLSAGKLLLQRLIHIKHFISDRLKNSIKQLNGKNLEFTTLEKFHLVEKINQNSYNKSFDLTKKSHIRKFDVLISKNKVTEHFTKYNR